MIEPDLDFGVRNTVSSGPLNSSYSNPVEEGLVPQAPIDIAGFPIGIDHALNRVERLVLLGFQKIGGERVRAEGF